MSNSVKSAFGVFIWLFGLPMYLCVAVCHFMLDGLGLI
jgi:hypothetical protein